MTGRIIAYLVAGAIALGLLLYVSHKVDGWFGGNADAATTAQSHAVVKLHASILKIRAHLSQVEQQKQALGLAAMALANALRDSAPPATSPDALVWRAIADTTRIAAAACFQALTTCQERARVAEQAYDSAITQLNRQTQVRNHPCGLSVGVGVTAGLVAGGYGGSAGLTALVGCQVIRSPWP